MTADDRERVRAERDRETRTRLQLPVDPPRIRYCHATKGYSAQGAGERCSLVAKPGSAFCGVHEAAAAGAYRQPRRVAA